MVRDIHPTTIDDLQLVGDVVSNVGLNLRGAISARSEAGQASRVDIVLPVKAGGEEG